MKKRFEHKKDKMKHKLLLLFLLAVTSLFSLRLEAEKLSSNHLYMYNKRENLLISQEPYWGKSLENVCDAQFADYKNKDSDIVPVLFVAYKDGRAGFLILPINGENEYLYREFDQKFEPREDGLCHIFEGKDKDDKMKPFIYFRVVDKNGETVNYAVYEGDF